MDGWQVVCLTSTVLICLLAFALNVLGLKVAKWLSGVGSLFTIATFLILLFLLIRTLVTRRSAADGSFSLAWPAFSLLTLNVFTKMALFALSGLDQCAIFSEECRKPKNDVARSVLLAAPLIALIYILGTISIIAYIDPANVDVAAPVSQVMQARFGATNVGRASTAIAVAVEKKEVIDFSRRTKRSRIRNCAELKRIWNTGSRFRAPLPASSGASSSR